MASPPPASMKEKARRKKEREGGLAGCETEGDARVRRSSRLSSSSQRVPTYLFLAQSSTLEAPWAGLLTLGPTCDGWGKERPWIGEG